MRTISNPSAGATIVGTIKAHEGGTGEVTAEVAMATINAIPNSVIGAANGVAATDASGRMLTANLPTDLFSSISIVGLLSLVKGTTGTYTIRNYDSFTEYNVTAVSGSVTRQEDVITFVAPVNTGVSGFVVNGRTYSVTISDAIPTTPVITSPTAGASVLAYNYSLTATPYSEPVSGTTHGSSDWQIATDVAFNTVVKSATDDAVNKTSWTVTGLADNTVYYARVRYKGNTGVYTPWSATVTFSVAFPVPATPTITAPANNSTTSQTSQTFTSSAFSIQGSVAVHQSSDWQFSKASDFSTFVSDIVADVNNKTSWTATGLTDATSYYVRVRHKASNGKVSPWSASVKISVVFGYVFNPLINGYVTNYNMRSAAIAAGWDQVKPLFMTVTVNSGVVIGSTTNTNYAFDTGAGFPAGSNLTVNIASGAYVVGCGGTGGGGENGNSSAMGNMRPAAKAAAGGPALIARQPVTINNMGVIGGGGGGGGGGAASAYLNDSFWGSAGSGGGGGAGSIVGLGGAGGLTHPGRTSPPEPGFAGSAGTLTTGGQGGVANVQQMNPIGYPGGTGGNLGQAGGLGGHPYGPSEATIASPAGAGGAAVTGNSNITWNNTGTRLGQIT